jgi:hypothetical protein
MNYYKLTVRVETAEGEQVSLETYRNFYEEKEILIFASGFADGLAMAHHGAVLEKQIEKLNNNGSTGRR